MLSGPRGLLSGRRRSLVLPNELPDLAAWWRFGLGHTIATGVSQWDDQSGNARHYLQATGTAQPAKQADGSLLFDGVDDSLKCVGFTLIQPTTVYILFNPITWTIGDYVCDGNADNSGAIQQNGVTPQMRATAGVALQLATTPIGAYAVAVVVFNGANSVFQINGGAPLVGNAGATNMSGACLGKPGASSSNFGNIQVKEQFICSSAHEPGLRAALTKYLLSL